MKQANRIEPNPARAEEWPSQVSLGIPAAERRHRTRNRWLGFVAAVVLATPAGPMESRAETKPPPDALQHWAFQAPKPARLPGVRNARWARTDIDRFILARLEAAGLAPAPAADARTLLRRMAFDLTGLPPTLEQTRQFVAAVSRDRDGAIRETIERLLASPQYGERWGRHWLDVARYSDTKGYVYAREERRFVHAPAYRDWVIRAFNEDLPYDRFLLLQLAADQLSPAGSPDLAAMGFITGGRRFIGVTHDIIDDRIDVVTRGTMGLTVQCARCHDHKYDPIPTADYYSLYGVFHGCDDRLVPLESSADAELAKRQKKLADTLQSELAKAAERLRARVGEYLGAQLELEKYPEEGFDQILGAEDLIPASVRRWRDFLHTSRHPEHSIFAPWYALATLEEASESSDAFRRRAEEALARVRRLPGLNPVVAAAFARPITSRREAAERYGQLFASVAPRTGKTNSPGASLPLADDAPGVAELRTFLADPRSPTVVPDTGIVNSDVYFPTAVTEAVWKLQGDVERRLIELGVRTALVLNDREPEPEPRIFRRGSPSKLGEPVPRRFLSVLSRGEPVPFRQGSGRLELARAIVDPQNALTARVMVNRIWQHHFGHGLVRTPSDLGLRAEPPSHPQLLDWLALRFMADGWSVKAMHRRILASAVYQQRSTGAGSSPERSALDPENRLLSRSPIRRLEFEAVRDAMLAASGELDLKMGGPARELLEPGNHRRTVYALVDRQFLPGTFRTFDFANPDIHVAVRHETTVPQQALYFLNGTFASDRARALARQVASRPPEERIRELHRTLYQREATANEIRQGLEFVAGAELEPAPAARPVRPSAWRYGTGAYDESSRRLKSFKPLPHFNGTAWQGAETFPGGETGWAQLTATGGHPGNTIAQACIRRWVAPRRATMEIAGLLRHEPGEGDGVRAFVYSSRHGELKSARVHHGKADLGVSQVTVEAGDTLDFIVDIGGTLSYDQFLWAPVLREGSQQTWDAQADFAGPQAAPQLLTAWEQYAQVLLLANEFAFVD